MTKKINWDKVTKWVAILSLPLTLKAIVEIIKIGLM